MKRLFLALAALAALALPARAADIAIPPYAGFVTDSIGLLQENERASLEAELRQYEQKTGTEIAILIVKDTGGLPAWEYATEAGNQWGIGKKGIDNGALILVAIESRDFWIATGRQLEGAVTDAEAGGIFREVVKPRFREGKYHEGLSQAVMALTQAIAGETFTDERMGQRRSNGGRNDLFNLISLGFMAFVIFLSWLAAILGRSKAIWPGGVLGAIGGAGAAWWLTSSLLIISVAAAATGLLGLLFDWIVSKNYDRYKGGGPRPPWFMGGGGFYGGGFGRRGGGGFGGFGGGGFSGGGGGGRW